MTKYNCSLLEISTQISYLAYILYFRNGIFQNGTWQSHGIKVFSTCSQRGQWTPRTVQSFLNLKPSALPGVIKHSTSACVCVSRHSFFMWRCPPHIANYTVSPCLLIFHMDQNPLALHLHIVAHILQTHDTTARVVIRLPRLNWFHSLITLKICDIDVLILPRGRRQPRWYSPGCCGTRKASMT